MLTLLSRGQCLGLLGFSLSLSVLCFSVCVSCILSPVTVLCVCFFVSVSIFVPTLWCLTLPRCHSVICGLCWLLHRHGPGGLVPSVVCGTAATVGGPPPTRSSGQLWPGMGELWPPFPSHFLLPSAIYLCWNSSARGVPGTHPFSGYSGEESSPHYPQLCLLLLRLPIEPVSCTDRPQYLRFNWSSVIFLVMSFTQSSGVRHLFH